MTTAAPRPPSSQSDSGSDARPGTEREDQNMAILEGVDGFDRDLMGISWGFDGDFRNFPEFVGI